MTRRLTRSAGFRIMIGPAVLLFSAGTLRSTGPLTARSASPIGYPPLTAPALNPPSAAKVALGRRLFFERRLSADGSVACADCHRPDHGLADSVPISRGAFGRHGRRKAPSLRNVGYLPTLMWDGRAADLESQMRLPLTNREEMGSSEASAVAALEADPSYVALFVAAFDDGRVSIARMGQAIASFERVALTGSNSRFDRFRFGGDAHAISASARRGWMLFQNKGCIACHNLEGGNPLFTDFQFHNIGIGYDTTTPDPGRYAITKAPADRGKFRTPSLVGIADHPPYMHDGRFRTLREVIDYYDKGAVPNPFLDAQIKPLRLTEQNKIDLVALLGTLSPVPDHRPLAASSRPARYRGAIGPGQRAARRSHPISSLWAYAPADAARGSALSVRTVSAPASGVHQR